MNPNAILNPVTIQRLLGLNQGDIASLEHLPDGSIALTPRVGFTLTAEHIIRLQNRGIEVNHSLDLSGHDKANADMTTYWKTALAAFNNWATLTAAQKDAVLKNLLKQALIEKGVI